MVCLFNGDKLYLLTCIASSLPICWQGLHHSGQLLFSDALYDEVNRRVVSLRMTCTVDRHTFNSVGSQFHMRAAFSALTLLVGWQEGIQRVKSWVVGCRHGCLSGARWRLAYGPLMPLPLTVSCFSKNQIGFTFLVPAHPGSPRQRAIKRVCVYCRNINCTSSNFQSWPFNSEVAVS